MSNETTAADNSLSCFELTDAQQDALKTIFYPYQKTCWKPVVEAGDCAHAGSKYFGDAWLAEGEAWPKLLGLDAYCVLQLDIKTLPDDMARLLGGEGLLQFFYMHEDAPWPYDVPDHQALMSLVRIVYPDRDRGAYVSQPWQDKAGEYAPSYLNGRACQHISGWEAIADYPHGCEYDEYSENEKMHQDIYSQLGKAELYADDFNLCHQGDKLDGYHFWSQGVRPKIVDGEEAVPFYQIDAGCFFDGPQLPAHAERLFASDGTGRLSVLPSDPTRLFFYWDCG